MPEFDRKVMQRVFSLLFVVLFLLSANGGELDYFVFTGGKDRSPKKVLDDYASLTAKRREPKKRQGLVLVHAKRRDPTGAQGRLCLLTRRLC
jgi:hypothetical protein